MPRGKMKIDDDLAYVKDKGIPLVEEQAAFHRRLSDQIARTPKGSDKARMHSKRAAAFGELAMVLASIQKHGQSIAGTSGVEVKANEPPAFLRIGDINELPEELRKQIKISESDKLDMDIIECIDAFGGTAAIDEILVQLWKDSGTILDRDYLARKIYRLTRNGALKSVKRKGYFTTDLSVENDMGEEEDIEDL